jgi:hypothetical protein
MINKKTIIAVIDCRNSVAKVRFATGKVKHVHINDAPIALVRKCYEDKRQERTV